MCVRSEAAKNMRERVRETDWQADLDGVAETDERKYYLKI